MFRYGVWSPPQDIWDTVVDFLGCEYNIHLTSMHNWHLYSELQELTPGTVIAVQKVVKLEFKVDVLKTIYCQKDVLNF